MAGHGFPRSEYRGPPQFSVRVLSYPLGGYPNLQSPQADDSTPLSTVGEADPDLQVLLDRVHEFLRLRKPAAAATRDVVPAPDPIPTSSSVLDHPTPPRGSERGKCKKPQPRKGRLRRIQDKFKLLLARFSRVSRGPITLSDGLVPEREENAEVSEGRYARLFG